MKEHIYLFLFLIGLLTMIIKRITFENTKSRVLQKNSLILHWPVDSTRAALCDLAEELVEERRQCAAILGFDLRRSDHIGRNYTFHCIIYTLHHNLLGLFFGITTAK